MHNKNSSKIRKNICSIELQNDFQLFYETRDDLGFTDTQNIFYDNETIKNYARKDRLEFLKQINTKK